MEDKELKKLLQDLSKGKKGWQDVYDRLCSSYFKDLGFAKVDVHRVKRKGFPEVIYCPGKSPEQIGKIAAELSKTGENLIATRAGKKEFEAVKKVIKDAEYSVKARLIYVKRKETGSKGNVVVISAGTSDIPVAEEAALTLEVTGSKAERIFDVGIAGLHRLVSFKEKLLNANAIVVVAGMEGALPSLVAGLVSCPVIGVPTSIGYGASLSGVTPLLSMLSSCAEGLAVVNIDNGFGAGYFASLINLKVCGS